MHVFIRVILFIGYRVLFLYVVVIHVHLSLVKIFVKITYFLLFTVQYDVI